DGADVHPPWRIRAPLQRCRGQRRLLGLRSPELATYLWSHLLDAAMVEEAKTRHYPIAWSGLISGPAAWAISTQLNYALVPWQCGEHGHPLSWIAFALILAAAAGGLRSLRARRHAREGAGVGLAAGVAPPARFLSAAARV